MRTSENHVAVVNLIPWKVLTPWIGTQLQNLAAPSHNSSNYGSQNTSLGAMRQTSYKYTLGEQITISALSVNRRLNHLLIMCSVETLIEHEFTMRMWMQSSRGCVKRDLTRSLPPNSKNTSTDAARDALEESLRNSGGNWTLWHDSFSSLDLIM